MRNLLLLFCFTFLSVGIASAQTITEYRAMKADKEATVADLQSQIDATAGEIEDLQRQIDLLSGWRTGYSGLLGFDLNNATNWIGNPNPNSTSKSLNIGLTGFANQDKEKTLWHNKGIITKAWQDVDLSDADTAENNDKLFDNGTVDILNLSSLGGYKITPKFALTALGELNTSVENFLKPGTADIGVGATWLPIENLTVVIHPLNYHIAWPADGFGDVASSGSLGAKFRADYTRDLLLNGRKIAWGSTLTGFVPYSDNKTTFVNELTGTSREAGLAEWSWLNTLGFEIWQGIGVGLGFGFRKADFESADLQRYTNLGLTYAL